jgi:hypothetical protein
MTDDNKKTPPKINLNGSADKQPAAPQEPAQDAPPKLKVPRPAESAEKAPAKKPAPKKPAAKKPAAKKPAAKKPAAKKPAAAKAEKPKAAPKAEAPKAAAKAEAPKPAPKAEAPKPTAPKKAAAPQQTVIGAENEPVPAGDELEEIVKATTQPINLEKPAAAPPAPAAQQQVENKKKSETTHIDLADAVDPTDAPDTRILRAKPSSPPRAQSLQEIDPDELQEMAKRSTVRINTAITEGVTQPVEEDLKESSMKSTVRVQVDTEARKGDTQRVGPAANKIPEPMKNQTSRIDISTVLDEDEEEDIFKRRTAMLDPSRFTGGDQQQGGAAPRTIRIKRPGTPPTAPTAVLPTESHPAAATNVPPTQQMAASPIVDEARKSETSRIDLPPEAMAKRPQTRRKTLKIKRPDGTSSQPVTAPVITGVSGTPTRTFTPSFPCWPWSRCWLLPY